MHKAQRYAKVAISGAFCRTFSYSVPTAIGELRPGQRVIVPFGRRSQVGYYLGDGAPLSGVTIKSVQRIVDPVSLIPPDLVSLCMWMAEYYVANPADCLALCLPSPIRNRKSSKLKWGAVVESLPDAVRALARPGKNIPENTLAFLKTRQKLSISELIERGAIIEVWPDFETNRREVVEGYRLVDTDAVSWDAFFRKRKLKAQPFEGTHRRDDLVPLGWTGHLLNAAIKAGLVSPVITDIDRSLEMIPARGEVRSHTLTDEQLRCVAAISGSLAGGFRTFLLHGITGSGKTLVYCRAAEDAVNTGKSVLFLTPEIALAGTILGYLRGYFGDQIAIMHSAMSERARMRTWEGIRSGKYRIVVGPRSALFAPLPDLGLIIVDEEHDSSYKQDDPSPRFHGRDSAIMRAQMAKVPAVLGSASPSVESYHQAQAGKYTLLELKGRPAGSRLPLVRVVDLREDRLGGDLSFVSYSLKKEVESRLEQNDQVILYLNRRGYASQLKCGLCGHVPNCPSCEIHMTYHKVGGGRLACHYCGLVRRDYTLCEKCGGHQFLFLGAGTQRLEESIARLFERGKPLRFDSDAAAGEFGAQTLLSDFGRGDYNLLLGTQMVTKGLDLPRVSLVGVLSADAGLDLPDFRASEKTFARLLQVAGRSGRGEKAGEVMIQTYDPENPVIALAAAQDYKGFFEREIVMRRDHEFPPFGRLVNIEFSGKREDQVGREISEFRRKLEQRLAAARLKSDILGPAPCPHSFVRGVHRRHLLLKTSRMSALSRMLVEWDSQETRFGVSSAIKVRVDVDPIDLM
jgi:primosomal protein N' (replication factor Y)